MRNLIKYPITLEEVLIYLYGLDNELDKNQVGSMEGCYIEVILSILQENSDQHRFNPNDLNEFIWPAPPGEKDKV